MLLGDHGLWLNHQYDNLAMGYVATPFSLKALTIHPTYHVRYYVNTANKHGFHRDESIQLQSSYLKHAFKKSRESFLNNIYANPILSLSCLPPALSLVLFPHSSLPLLPLANWDSLIALGDILSLLFQKKWETVYLDRQSRAWEETGRLYLEV